MQEKIISTKMSKLNLLHDTQKVCWFKGKKNQVVNVLSDQVTLKSTISTVKPVY